MIITDDQKKYVLNRLSRAKEFRVNIVIGPAVEVFKSIYKDPYETITTAEELRTFLAKWNVPYDKPIVFEDISLMTPSVQAALLKFIEEPPAPLIILASLDNVNSIILSRCKNIVKIPSEVPTPTLKLSEFIERKDKEELPEDLNITEASLQLCPEYYYRIAKIQQTGKLIKPDRYLKLLD